ncbi:unnamed protein product [Moneuplotes crassus]|uniref:Uncharacterized protein n=1 Tax=Euplotes crassus TaxID=5936 RepID=A0AAD2D3P3_EUPCR|nr:unnamed protein product [Moneuplotes crassus]
MYKVGVKQKRFNEESLTIEKVKAELPDALNEENKRVNVDSSKKLACKQYMDYDGFHQMVLGANLIPIKKGSLDSIGDRQMKWHGMNTHAALTDILNKNYKDKADILDSYVDLFKKEEELKRVPKTQSEFEKYFCSKLKTSEDRFKYILNIPISEAGTIFSSEVNSELLVQILKVFQEVISDRIQMQNDENSTEENESTGKVIFTYIGDFMNVIGQSEGFDFCVCFLGDEEKDIVAQICTQLAEIEYPDVGKIKEAYQIE